MPDHPSGVVAITVMRGGGDNFAAEAARLWREVTMATKQKPRCALCGAELHGLSVITTIRFVISNKDRQRKFGVCPNCIELCGEGLAETLYLAMRSCATGLRFVSPIHLLSDGGRA